MVYLICFEKHFSHAKHYIGYCADEKFEARIKAHRTNRGSKLLAALNKAGIDWEVVRTWPDEDGNFERKLKNRKNSAKLCPHCKHLKSNIMVRKNVLLQMTATHEEAINNYVLDVMVDIPDRMKHVVELPLHFDLIRTWAKDRGIYEKGDTNTQFIKLTEEVGELAKGLLTKDKPLTQDSIGDCIVVLTNLAHLAGFTVEECIESAWKEIANRKGAMKNGTFVKEA